MVEMKALAGKRAVVVAPGRPHAGVVAGILAAQGAEVAEWQEVSNLDDADIVVTCPVMATQTPGNDAAAVLDYIADVGRWNDLAARAMRRRRSGAIVHITGLSGLGGWPGWGASGLAFSAIHNLVGSSAVEFAKDGVRINALVPGVTADLGATIAAASGVPLDAVRARIPQSRFLGAEELGHALVYLVHDSSSYVTGEVLTVDGGWDIWGRLYAAAAR